LTGRISPSPFDLPTSAEVLLNIRIKEGACRPSPYPEEPKSGRKLGVGIAGMLERILQLGGSFEIAAGNPGAIIKAVFPLPARSASVFQTTPS